MFDEEENDTIYEEEPMDLANKEEEIKESYVTEENDEEEEYEEFKDVGILEINTKLHKFLTVLVVLLVIGAILATIDIIAVLKFDKGPYFALPLTKYYDGGTQEYYGLGYKVIKYHQVQGRRDKVLGFWNLKYNTTATTVQDIDLAIGLTDNPVATYDKYDRKFVRITSTLYDVRVADRQIILGYLDEGGKYSLNIVCNMVEDQNNLDVLEINKEITIIGTVREFKNNTKEGNKKLYISDCFAEQ